ncbi:MAG: hypothetical protein SGI92_11000 [Bryobacteraceae bacterium]|nr:hypothetical protein [Bryobacteraceae bacterium]
MVRSVTRCHFAGDHGPAGGVTTYEDVEALLAMNVYAALGMAIYTGRLDLIRLAEMQSDRRHPKRVWGPAAGVGAHKR